MCLFFLFRPVPFFADCYFPFILNNTMPNLKDNDNALREVLTQAKAIAVVGHSDRANRTSYQIAQFLRQAGYTVYPINS
jgi:CoA binding domain